MYIYIYPNIYSNNILHLSWQETRLRAERDDKVRLRGQAGIHKRNGEENQGVRTLSSTCTFCKAETSFLLRDDRCCWTAFSNQALMG